MDAPRATAQALFGTWDVPFAVDRGVDRGSAVYGPAVTLAQSSRTNVTSMLTR
jgi:hypothetical protein